VVVTDQRDVNMFIKLHLSVIPARICATKRQRTDCVGKRDSVKQCAEPGTYSGFFREHHDERSLEPSMGAIVWGRRSLPHNWLLLAWIALAVTRGDNGGGSPKLGDIDKTLIFIKRTTGETRDREKLKEKIRNSAVSLRVTGGSDRGPCIWKRYV